jgi:hypothetical protein
MVFSTSSKNVYYIDIRVLSWLIFLSRTDLIIVFTFPDSYLIEIMPCMSKACSSTHRSLDEIIATTTVVSLRFLCEC